MSRQKSLSAEMKTSDCDGLFDGFDDLLDVPVEDVQVGGGSFDNFQGLSSLPQQDPIDICFSVPYEEFPPLDWLPTFMDDSFSTGSTKLNPTPTTTTTTTTTTATTTTTIDNQNGNNNNNNDSHQFQSSSPTSVLESSDSYSGEKNISLNADMFVEARARSISPPPVSSSKTKRSSKKMKRNKRRKIDPLLSSPVDQDIVPSIAAVRKCLHCEITKTPQWREGPLGPKTLCNACGVRYKSGRLFPEYRPAASPTFVPELHSNSHKKVLEMRIKS